MTAPSAARGAAGRTLALRTLQRTAFAAAIVLELQPAWAMGIATGSDDWQLRWDNTVKYSSAWRLKSADPALLFSPNHDDGDRNFGKGLVSSRVDLFSELDLSDGGRRGLRLSAAAWYDAVYNRGNDNPGFPGGAFPNRLGAANRFAPATRDLHGRSAEMLDAFVFGKVELDGGASLSGRLGRHSLLWGESLFFGANAIAGGQQPVDAVKLLSVPGTPFKEAVRPEPQVSGQIQFDGGVSIGAYYQFRWVPTRAPAVGSYFSDVDVVVRGAEQLLLPAPLPAAPRGADREPPSSGQGGLQWRWRAAETDLGLYAVRFHAKTPQVVPIVGFVVPPPAAVVAPVGFRQVYHEGIVAFGASASRTFGDVNLAVEASLRRNQDLASTRGVDASAVGGPPIDGDNPGYAIGRTAHLNVSMLANLPSTPLWREANLVGELAWNRVLRVTRNAAALDPNASRDGGALRLQIEPRYRQVLPGLDLAVPVGLGWSPKGSRSMALGPVPMPANGHGELSIGVNGSYLDAWRFTLGWTHFYGQAAPLQIGSSFTDYSYAQTLKDRDFVSLSIQRSF